MEPSVLVNLTIPITALSVKFKIVLTITTLIVCYNIGLKYSGFVEVQDNVILNPCGILPCNHVISYTYRKKILFRHVRCKNPRGVI